MASSNFIDHVRIYARSGAGGSGSLHFRREKGVPKGGPDGGDGGRGGHIILKGSRNLWTLLHLRYRKHIHGFNGGNGGGSQSSGAEGKDVIVEVPLGTVVKDAETGEKLFEITENEQQIILLKGGRGGLGNVNFKSATNQTPYFSQTGEEEKDNWFVLELKVLADVGLVGFPNAGKSTLLSVVSAAKPKIADYAFTTLTPNLGVVNYRNTNSFIIADIPGIIEGASEGKGLGTRFLRHIERNTTLLFLVPADADNIKESYKILLSELKKHNPELLDKNRVLAISKSDLLDDELENELKKELPENIPYIFISSVTQKGIVQLKDMIWKALNNDAIM